MRLSGDAIPFESAALSLLNNLLAGTSWMILVLI